VNRAINDYFDSIEAFSIESPIIRSYLIIRREVSSSDGKIRIRMQLINDSIIEIFEYVNENEKRITSLKYSYHWQNSENNLIKRWDNAPHFPNIESFPHHVHTHDISVKEVPKVPKVPNIFSVLKEIRNTLIHDT